MFVSAAFESFLSRYQHHFVIITEIHAAQAFLILALQSQFKSLPQSALEERVCCQGMCYKLCF